MRPQKRYPPKKLHCYRRRESGGKRIFHGIFPNLFLDGYAGTTMGGDTEVLEDFSPLSTNATYWKTCQDTFEGAMSRCPMRDACGGCAKGKYSQISVGGRGCFPRLYTKMEGGADFP